jgi:uncharacterized protein (TIGR02466 family)
MTTPPWKASFHALFPTPLFVFELADHREMDQHLLQSIYHLRQTEPGVVASNILGWHSKTNLFELPDFQAFKRLVDEAIVQVAQAVGYGHVNIRPANCWANINPPNASNKIHDHANCLFSGVYYVRAPENCGNLMLYDPRSARTFYRPAVKDYTAYTADAVAHAAETGLLLIFPSWLKHGVDPNLSQEERVSISFNYVFS